MSCYNNSCYTGSTFYTGYTTMNGCTTNTGCTGYTGCTSYCYQVVYTNIACNSYVPNTYCNNSTSNYVYLPQNNRCRSNNRQYSYPCSTIIACSSRPCPPTPCPPRPPPCPPQPPCPPHPCPTDVNVCYPNMPCYIDTKYI